MVKINERIIDPEQFFPENSTLITDLTPGSSQIISAPDFDVIVKADNGIDPRSAGRIDHEVSRALGQLYIHHEIQGFRLGGKLFDIDLYPSPQAVNTLTSQLGLEPGVDVFKFLHSRRAEIPAKEYAVHLGRGEFPQSAGLGPYKHQRTFHHDRGRDHIPGVILMPPYVMKYIMNRALAKPSVDISRIFDTTTGSLKYIINELWTNLDRDVDNEYARELDEASRFSSGLYRECWEEQGKKFSRKSHNEVYRLAGAVTLEHLRNLKPCLDATKSQLGTTVFI